jgi:hypothetical protein
MNEQGVAVGFMMDQSASNVPSHSQPIKIKDLMEAFQDGSELQVI